MRDDEQGFQKVGMRVGRRDECSCLLLGLRGWQMGTSIVMCTSMSQALIVLEQRAQDGLIELASRRRT